MGVYKKEGGFYNETWDRVYDERGRRGLQ